MREQQLCELTIDRLPQSTCPCVFCSARRTLLELLAGLPPDAQQKGLEAFDKEARKHRRAIARDILRLGAVR